MDLVHNFRVNAPIDETWAVLNDIPRVAKCMPGASVNPEKKDPYEGTVTVKVGAVTQKFQGTINFVENDANNHKMVLALEGRDIRGASGAKAGLTLELQSASAEATDVSVLTELQLSGKVAQFGRKMLEDVSGSLLTIFVRNLEAELGSPAANETPAAEPTPQAQQATQAPAPTQAVGGGATAPAQSAPGGFAQQDEEVLDLGSTVLPTLVKQYAAPVAIGVSLVCSLWALVRTFRRRRPNIPYEMFRNMDWNMRDSY